MVHKFKRKRNYQLGNKLIVCTRNSREFSSPILQFRNETVDCTPINHKTTTLNNCTRQLNSTEPCPDEHKPRAAINSSQDICCVRQGTDTPCLRYMDSPSKHLLRGDWRVDIFYTGSVASNYKNSPERLARCRAPSSCNASQMPLFLAFFSFSFVFLS